MLLNENLFEEMTNIEELCFDNNLICDTLSEQDLKSFDIDPVVNTFDNAKYYTIDTGSQQQVVIAVSRDNKVCIEEDTDDLGFAVSHEFASINAFMDEYLKLIDKNEVNENLSEAIDNMSKDEYLRNAAEIAWESGHSYDPDDFSYFKKVCKEDGYNVTEEDFQKYFEYFDECRANQFADDDSIDTDLGPWEEMESKQVEDSDGFMTDYTWYVKDNDDGSETHVMIFGDQDLYTPMNSEPDAEFDAEDTAREWFDSYKGFTEDLDEDYHKDSFGQSNWYEDVDDVMHDYEKGWLTKSRAIQICDEEGWEFYDDLDEAVNSEAELVNGYKVFKADSTNTWFVMDGQNYHNEAEFEGKGYPTKEQAIERANSLEKGSATTLEEAIKPDITSDELKALAQKHNIKILDAMDNGDLRMEGAGADLMKFYQEAEQLGLWEVDPSLYEALHSKEELNEFTQLANKLGFTTTAQMKHIMNAAKSLGKSELEMLKDVSETFNGKIPDTLIDGLTDTFLVVAEEVGLESDEDYQRFVKEEVQPGETITQAILRYRDEIKYLDINESVEKLEEIAVLNINKESVLDAIANAKAYVQENKFPQAKDSLNYASKLLDNPLEEGAMSNLDLEIKEVSNEQDWKDKANKELTEMEDALHYLKTYAPKEVGAGGNFDSIQDLNDSIEDLEKDIDELKKKLNYVNSIKRIGG